jgi:hypothetical protein
LDFDLKKNVIFFFQKMLKRLRKCGSGVLGFQKLRNKFFSAMHEYIYSLSIFTGIFMVLLYTVLINIVFADNLENEW